MEGAGTSFTATGTTTHEGADIEANTGAQISLSVLQKITGDATLTATDLDSLLDLPLVTQATVPNYYHLQLYCTGGVQIQLPKLAAFTSGTIDAFADGDDSVIDLSGWNGPLTNTSSATMYLTVANDGTILIPGVTALDRVPLTIRGTGIIPTTQLTALTWSSVVIDGAQVNFGALADTTGTTFDYRNGGTAVFLAPADLVVSAVLAPATAVAKQPVPIVWEIANRGTGLTNGVWSDALFLSADAQPGNDELVGLFPSSATLSSGASRRSTNTVMFPAERSGNWYLVVAANQARSVFEGTNTVNNTNISTTPIQILAPDLVLNSVTARDVRISSAQPKIVDDDKGLLVDFKIIATEVAGHNIEPSLTVDFGKIDPGTNAIGRWLLTSTLLGGFIEYSATFEHLNGLDQRKLSLVEGVEIHELNHIVRAPGIRDDGRPDFLVNDLADLHDRPDTIHLSDGTLEPMSVVTEATIDGEAAPTHLDVVLTASCPTGFVCLRVPDPGGSGFRLTRVVRSDGMEIALGDNAWTTDRTFLGNARRPIPENILHLFDSNSPGRYTLTYTALPPRFPQLHKSEADHATDLLARARQARCPTLGPNPLAPWLDKPPHVLTTAYVYEPSFRRTTPTGQVTTRNTRRCRL